MEELIFRARDHSYWRGDKSLISVTQLMKKHGLAPTYSMVNCDVLKAKAERGTLVHKEIENYLKIGEAGFTTELMDFINLYTANEIHPTGSEIMVGNDIIAGTIDIIANHNGCLIADIKTTATIHKDSVKWQLSIYARLYEDQFGIKAQGLGVFHLNKNSKYIPIEFISPEEVDKLFECEKKGAIYQKKELVISEDLLEQVNKAEALIKFCKEQKDIAEQNAEKVKQVLMKVMARQGIKSYETLDKAMKITYIEPTTRESIDIVKLKKELPDIAKQFNKISKVKASLKVTLRG